MYTQVPGSSGCAFTKGTILEYVLAMTFISNLHIISYGLYFTLNIVVEYIQMVGPVWLLKAVYPLMSPHRL